MANQFLTLKDVTALDKLGDAGSVGLVDNIVNVAPELDRIMGRPIPGISYEATILTAIGSNASWRKVNSGVPLSAPSVDTKRFNCMPFDCQFSVDEATLEARRSTDSPAYVFETFMTSGARQKAIHVGRQVYQGSLNDPLGPPGMIDYLITSRTMVDSRTGLKIDQFVDAGGTTNGQCEFVWFIKMGPQGFHFLFGNGRGIYMNPFRFYNLESPDSTPQNRLYQGCWRANMFGYLGTSMANYHAIGAVGNINSTPTISGTTVSYTNGLNDALIAQLWRKWPITEKPDICFATQNAIASLQNSRTVTNFVNGPREWTKGSAPLADWPTTLPTAGNIPIIATDSIQPGNQFFPS